jgi:uncharacterized membrane protein YphA (DoxX/SURF4 family)
MQTKTRKIVNTLVTVIPASLVILSGFMKFNPPTEMLTEFQRMGIAQHMPMFGIMEFLFAALFIVPQTRRVGFVLLSCYFAGAIATDLSHGKPVHNAMLPITLVWIGMFIADRAVFFPMKKTVATA